jgi:hypothetical protein
VCRIAPLGMVVIVLNNVEFVYTSLVNRNGWDGSTWHVSTRCAKKRSAACSIALGVSDCGLPPAVAKSESIIACLRRWNSVKSKSLGVIVGATGAGAGSRGKLAAGMSWLAAGCLDLVTERVRLFRSRANRPDPLLLISGFACLFQKCQTTNLWLPTINSNSRAGFECCSVGIDCVNGGP